jgi:hypothetical protein
MMSYWRYREEDMSTLRLAADEERVLEYFWDHGKDEVRRRLPDSVIVCFESEGSPPRLSEVNRAWAEIVTRVLTSKGYLAQQVDCDGQRCHALTSEGAAYLRRRHPATLAKWGTLPAPSRLETTLIAGVIGLGASVLGLLHVVTGR